MLTCAIPMTSSGLYRKIYGKLGRSYVRNTVPPAFLNSRRPIWVCHGLPVTECPQYHHPHHWFARSLALFLSSCACVRACARSMSVTRSYRVYADVRAITMTSSGALESFIFFARAVFLLMPGWYRSAHRALIASFVKSAVLWAVYLPMNAG